MIANRLKKISPLAGFFLLTACAVGPTYQAPPLPAASAWLTPQTAATNRQNLNAFWQQFDDPAISDLIDAAQQVSPSLAAAQARIAQARAQLASAGGAQFPSLDLNGRLVRGNQTAALNTSVSLSLDSLWELDIWGANAATRTAAQARLQARNADWHEARISLAAEVASQVVNYRSCLQLVAVQTDDLASRRQTAFLSQLKAGAGFAAPSDARLSQASVADAQQRLLGQQTECELTVQALVFLTDQAETPLRKVLQARSAIPSPQAFVVDSLPASLLAQRPDLAALERELLAASREIGIAQANQLPRISLLGSIGVLGVRLGGNTDQQTSWSLGPSLTLPIFDAGRRKAGADAAQARFDEARANFDQRLRLAVREVEEALLRLNSATRRDSDAQAAATDYGAFFTATEARFGAGAANLLDLEEARRVQLAARQAAIAVQRERVQAWIALYKSLGGGWSKDAPATLPQSSASVQ